MKYQITKVRKFKNFYKQFVKLYPAPTHAIFFPSHHRPHIFYAICICCHYEDRELLYESLRQSCKSTQKCFARKLITYITLQWWAFGIHRRRNVTLIRRRTLSRSVHTSRILFLKYRRVATFTLPRLVRLRR